MHMSKRYWYTTTCLGIDMCKVLMNEALKYHAHSLRVFCKIQIIWSGKKFEEKYRKLANMSRILKN